MNDLNSINIVGRLTRDAEVKYTQGGAAIVSASIANGYSKKVGDSWENQTNFYDVTMFGKFAESMSKHMTKGKQIAITGCIRQETWEKDGEKRSKVKIIAEAFQLLGSSRSDGEQVQRNERTDKFDGFKDDIPF